MSDFIDRPRINDICRNCRARVSFDRNQSYKKRSRKCVYFRFL